MNTLIYILDGHPITLHLRYTAKRNIIFRKHGEDSLLLSIPPHLSEKKLRHWLSQHHQHLYRVLTLPCLPSHLQSLPKHIWFLGHHFDIHIHEHCTSLVCDVQQHQFILPPADIEQQKKWLVDFLHQQARSTLLPRLSQHALALNLHPVAINLTHAKGFWGVCRHHTGIRLNWRLIGAPDAVIDYVCIHELCHLQEPNHSLRFWNLVNQYTSHTDFAKQWLKQYGSELFVLA